MTSKILYTFLIIFFNNFLFLSVGIAGQFNFNITELEILENGDIIKGLKKGTIESDTGLQIDADTFIFNKKSNILIADGNVKIVDVNKDTTIFSDNIIYQKNKEIITTNKNSKAIFQKNIFIIADKFEFNRNQNILNAKGNVKIQDQLNDYLVTGNDITYYQNSQKIVTRDKTKAIIESKYKITSKNLEYLINENNLSSKNKTKIEDDNSRIYFVENFDYSINEEILKGEKILIITNFNLPNSDKIFLENAIINLKSEKFVAKNPEIELHKSIYNNPKNDPRLKGVSTISENDITVINKGIFTSCAKNDNCPPWSIQAEKIEHDKKKKQLKYDNAILKVYNFPILYFPKFFHPDPSVNRQSGILKPMINNSNILGNSLTLPYFKVIDTNKDLTFTPTFFNNNTLMSQTEYRLVEKNYELLTDVGYVKGYKSKSKDKKNSLSHLFLDLDLDLNLENFISSNLALSLEKVSNDSYLQIFDTHITKSKVRPENFNKLNNNLKIFLNHENYNFETGIESFEDLQIKSSDRFQYILPYYKFEKTLSQDYLSGSFNFDSSGSNDLSNTNNLKTNIVNNVTYNSLDFISNFGLKNNFNISLQNLNSIGKKFPNYKSSPQIELASLFNADLSVPLSKKDKNYNSFLTPKFSFRFNPSKMKDYSSSENRINVNNVFSFNRLGLSDTLEAGRSVTLGLDYRRENKNDLNEINNYFELKLATVLRDKKEKFIPKKSTIYQKSSNLFGSINNKISDNLEFGYDFSLDNDYKTFEYNDFNATFSINNFVTTFNFIEESGQTGDANILANSISYNLNDQNSLKFKTRRNRKLNLTEYYDLVYEYQNDCLTAGVKYKKTYYSDGDIKPTENLLFTITLFPLTSYEYQANEMLNQ